MFSFLSFSEKPRSLFSPNRTLSPSSRYAARPRCRRCCSRAVATVDLPDAERPVNQIVKPLCFLSSVRSRRESEGCQVIFLSPPSQRRSSLASLEATHVAMFTSLHFTPKLEANLWRFTETAVDDLKVSRELEDN